MSASAPILRLTHAVSTGVSTLDIAFEEPGQPRQAITIPFTFAMPPEDQESLRWYYEDYLQFPDEPAPQIAARVESRMSALGKELFSTIFEHGDPRDLWAQVRNRLSETRVEVVADISEGSAVPWELLWDPKTDVPIAIRAATFVRGYTNPAQRPRIPAVEPEQVRVLLAICRPSGSDDVPFRSVASRLVKSLGVRRREDFRLDVLRPPTFLRLAEVLREAAAEEPYHVVHFDGHGIYERAPGQPNARGYVLFEDRSATALSERVDGSRLGALLVETGVPILVLNACRSARSDPSAAPIHALGDAHGLVRAYGSLAAEVMDTGVAGVVAMDYNVYVVTAALFLGDVYATLARGQALGQAVSIGRKQLHAKPLRDLIGAEIELRDWSVPVVYEAAPIPLFKASSNDLIGAIDIDAAIATPRPDRGTLDGTLPAAPDAGFFGRDETLLAIDRAFDTERIVLLHGYAGSGKTTTAAEFGRWYALTGGVEGPILFTSFEQYSPLPRVLDTFHRVFGSILADRGLDLLALPDAARRRIAIATLSSVPVLWIWDNVESVRGLGTTASAMPDSEQVELLDFLRDLRTTKALVLLTSRREEHPWLGDLPARVALPPMPMLERLQLARALAVRRGRPILTIGGWRPLLAFTAGNPLTVAVVVGEALRQGLESREEIEPFVKKLRSGQANVPDDATLGRTTSLIASLNYGFHEAFEEAEQRLVALLHLFQGTVTAFLFWSMGAAGDDSLPELAAMSQSAVTRLLNLAADIGQLTEIGSGVYAIHPALPAHFSELFKLSYPGGSGIRATRAFCAAVVEYGGFLANTYEERGGNAIRVLATLEQNLLYARQLARGEGWHDVVIRAMMGLNALYSHQGRWVEWARLLDDVVPDYVDPKDDGPISVREPGWYQLTQFRVRIAFERNTPGEALRLQEILVRRALGLVDEVSKQPSESLDSSDRGHLVSASIALAEFGLGQLEQRNVEAVATLERSVDMARRSGDTYQEGRAIYNLAVALLMLFETPDLDRALALLNRGLEVTAETDYLRRSRFYAEVGFVHMQRASDAASRGETQHQVQELGASMEAYEMALKLTPVDAEQSLAAKHANLGTMYHGVGENQRALYHLQQSIHYAERTADPWTAGLARFRMALVLRDAGRKNDAVVFAERALSDLEPLGQKSSKQTAALRTLLAELKL